MNYEAVIGLEIHSELKTNTKIFCGCATEFGAEQNTHVCPVCLGLPGVLPVVNKRVVEFAIKAGLALNCTINKFSKFDRKNYYYPDLPKNFQTSQYDLPIAEHGYVDIDVDGKKKRIRITRIHMEEDAGKLVHSGTNIKDSATSNVDYNRTGVPLIEIVSEPDMSTPQEARLYMEKIKANQRPAAEENVKTDIVLDAIAKAENIQLDMADVDAEIAAISAQHGASADEVKKIIKSNGTMGLLLANILRRKAAHVILDSAK